MIDQLSPELEARLHQTLTTKIDQLLAPIEQSIASNVAVREVPLLSEDHRPPGTTHSRHDHARRSARLAVVGTLLVAAAATAALAVSFGRDRPEITGSSQLALVPSPVVITADDTTTPGEQMSSTTAGMTSTLPSKPPDPLERLSRASGWYLPAYVPDGYELTSLTAHAVDQRPSPGRRWVRRDPITGEVVSMVSVRVADIPAPDSGIPQQRTVHGRPATVSDTGEGILASWIEGDALIEVRGLGMDEERTTLAAEAFVVDATTRTATLDLARFSDFELAAPVVVPEGDHVRLGLNYQSARGPTSDFIGASISPNLRGDTVEMIFTRFIFDDENVETVDGKQLLVRRQLPDGLGPFTTVTWFDGPTRFDVSGRAPADEVMAFARSLTTASYDEARALGAEITQRALALDTIGMATFDDGVRVSIRGRSSNPHVICIEHPVVRCSYKISESFLVGDQQIALAQIFEVDGRQVLIAWSTSIQPPELAASGMTNDPSTPPAVFTSATIKQSVATNAEQFIEVEVPAGELPPSLRLNDEFGGYSEIAAEPLGPENLSY